MTAPAGRHAALMDATYRRQRHIYDLTRKYFLFGRDHLIADLAVAPGGTVLEVACGTGRNLAKIGRAYPDAALYGLDISDQMLMSARAKLGDRAALAQADACAFEPAAIFDVAQFDRIVLSYGISMIPDWTGAIGEALRHLAPGGSLHIVDFGTQAGWPRWFRTALRGWIAKFHVAPRDELGDALSKIAAERGFNADTRLLYGGYAVYAVVRRA